MCDRKVEKRLAALLPPDLRPIGKPVAERFSQRSLIYPLGYVSAIGGREGNNENLSIVRDWNRIIEQEGEHGH